MPIQGANIVRFDTHVVSVCEFMLLENNGCRFLGVHYKPPVCVEILVECK